MDGWLVIGFGWFLIITILLKRPPKLWRANLDAESDRFPGMGAVVVSFTGGVIFILAGIYLLTRK